MPEPLTLSLVSELMPRLHAAFPRNLGKDNPTMMVEVYRNGLRGLSGDALRAAVDVVIRDDSYFPKVSRLREVARAWSQRNEVQAELQGEPNPLWCQVCRSSAEWRKRWRPIVDTRGRVVVSDDGAYVLLEQYERLLCRCAAACAFTPELHIETPMMPRERALARGRAIVRASEWERRSRPNPLASDVAAASEHAAL